MAKRRASSKGREAVDVQRLYDEIGFRCRIAREAVGLTQHELAARLRHSRASIANLETGRQRPPVHVIFEIAAALKVRVRSLLPSKIDV